ncbi:MAG: phosphoribosylglycinamide formyltransferase [Vampirovibrionales bacterium]|nr:phosphoribosylglycinamide formyltransferase [Vampirovibrionales bacterium]
MSQPVPQSPQKLAVLISGRGSNLAAIVDAIEDGRLSACQVSVVISNKKNAAGLDIARQANIPAEVVTMRDLLSDEKKPLEVFDAEILAILRQYHIDAVALAGYGRIISSVLLEAYAGRIVNIHPSLLPDFGGKGMLGNAVHQAVLEASRTNTDTPIKTESGCSVHLVSETIDGGPILGQAKVPVLTEDTVESLSRRVLSQEHKLYPAVLQAWVSLGYPARRLLDLDAQAVGVL